MSDIGILDPNGLNPNPLNNEPYSDDYKNLAKIWSSFPAYKERKKILKTLIDNQVTLIISQTGSGKTVLLPKFLLHVFDYKKKIAITLPKQIITKSSAEFSAKTLDVKLGDQVGYQFKGESKKSKNTKLLYSTDGSIVSMLLHDPLLSEFDAVIIDEAHERKVQIDFLLLLLKNVLRNRPDFKLVIMSATINEKIFEAYFEEFKFKSLFLTGETLYPIEDIYLDFPIRENEYIDKSVEIVVDLVNKKDMGDVLVFITSSNEAFEICEKLQSKLGQKTKLDINNNVFCVELYSGVSSKNQELATDATLYQQGRDKVFGRKVVVATNVAESSLTVDGIKFVIDNGWQLSSKFNPQLRARELNKERITKAQAKQRRGRAGRTSAGTCFHLYTLNEYNNFDEFPEPNIRTEDITSDLLRLMNLPNIQNTKNLLELLTQFIEPPREAGITSSIQLLNDIGCIKDEKITALGIKISEFSGLDPQNVLALIVAHNYNCAYEVINVLAMMETSKYNVGSIFMSPKDQIRKKMYQKKSKFKTKSSDHLSLLTIFEKYTEQASKHDGGRKWCYDNFIRCDVMAKAKKYAKKLDQNYREVDLSTIKVEINEEVKNKSVQDRILYSFMTGLQNQIAKKKGDYYETKYAKKYKIGVGKDSFLADKPPAKCIYSELFITRGMYNLNIVSTIK